MSIEVRPDELERTADDIRLRASRVHAAVEQIERELRSMGPDRFSGQRADELRARYEQMRSRLEEFDDILRNFSTLLDGIAIAFREADR